MPIRRVTVPQAAAWLLLGALLYVLVVCAWQCDDAYITFRTVRNLWNGRGLTWNPDERVQAYTHPLWMFVAVLAYGISHEAFFGMTLVAIATATASVIPIARLCRGHRELVVTLLVLISSYSFIDFSVSGLENPLLNALLGWTIVASLQDPEPRSDLLFGLCTAGVFLTRADAVLLVAPLWLVRWRKPLPSRASLLGLLPCAAWESFSLVYYGSLVPNTALAKLNLAIPSSRLASEGAHYVADDLRHDPVTLLATLLCVMYAVLRGGKTERALVAGVAIYLVYVVRIGGDFMSGRFFGAPLVVALCAANLAAMKREPSRHALRLGPALVAALVLYNAAWPRAPIHSTLAFGEGYVHGAIADERAFYYPYTGLLPILVHYPELQDAKLPIPPLPSALVGRGFAAAPSPRVMTSRDVGALGYRVGDKVVIDLRALADPLLARIVFRPTSDGFRVGHYERGLPRGYVESRAMRENLIAYPALHEAYDAVLLAVRGPLFDAERWRAIWRLNTGYFDPAFAAADSGGNAILHAR